MEQVRFQLLSNGRHLLTFLNSHSNKDINMTKNMLKLNYFFTFSNKPKYLITRTTRKFLFYEEIQVYKNIFYEDSIFLRKKNYQSIARVSYVTPHELLESNNLDILGFNVTTDPFKDDIQDHELGGSFMHFLENSEDFAKTLKL